MHCFPFPRDGDVKAGRAHRPKPTYMCNLFGLLGYAVQSRRPIKGEHATIKLDFHYDGDGIGKGGVATLFVNGDKVAEGRIEKTQPAVFSADETADVGKGRFTRFRRFSNGFADRYPPRHRQTTRTKRVSGHSYDNVTNPRCESGARRGVCVARVVRCREARAGEGVTPRTPPDRW